MNIYPGRIQKKGEKTGEGMEENEVKKLKAQF